MPAASTVFVVDDDQDARDSLGALMRANGLHVETFRNAEEFLESFDVTRHGCIVLDVHLPGMNGLDLQDQLSARGSCIPVIFVTGYADVQMCGRAFRAGAYHFLEKPVSGSELLHHVHAALEEDLLTEEMSVPPAEISARLSLLTPREREVMDMLVAGKGLKQIAMELDVSGQTAAKHRSRVLEKLQVDGNVAMVRLVIAHKFATFGELGRAAMCC